MSKFMMFCSAAIGLCLGVWINEKRRHNVTKKELADISGKEDL